MTGPFQIERGTHSHGPSREAPGGELACVQRPDFFCGQLLTDHDLDAVVAWARQRLRLQRFRSGWGVVCGLDVACDFSEPNRPKITVGPGYAVSGCGEDIVECGDYLPEPIDVLKQEARAAFQPLKEVPSLNLPEAFQTILSESNAVIHKVDLCIRPKSYPAVHDLSYRYRAVPHSAHCETSRWTEGGELYLDSPADQHEPAECDPGRYNDCCDVIAHYIECTAKLGARDKQNALQKKKQCLLRWIAKHPLHQFCWIERFVRSIEGDSDAPFVQALFWIVQDCRNALATRHCACTSAGVRLARIWLVQVHGCWSVVAINSRPPYRRMLSVCPTAPRGSMNLIDLLWKTANEAETVLRAMNVTVTTAVLVLPENVTTLKEELHYNGKSLCVVPKSKVTLSTYPGANEYVVGFEVSHASEPLDAP